MYDLKNKGVNTIVEQFTRNEKLIIASLMIHNEDYEAWYIDWDVQLIWHIKKSCLLE